MLSSNVVVTSNLSKVAAKKLLRIPTLLRHVVGEFRAGYSTLPTNHHFNYYRVRYFGSFVLTCTTRFVFINALFCTRQIRSQCMHTYIHNASSASTLSNPVCLCYLCSLSRGFCGDGWETLFLVSGCVRQLLYNYIYRHGFIRLGWIMYVCCMSVDGLARLITRHHCSEPS